MRFRSIVCALAVCATYSVVIPVQAEEIIRFRYDARGQLVRIANEGSTNPSQTVDITYDRAGNRSYLTVTNAQPPTLSVHGGSAVEGNPIVFQVSRQGRLAEEATTVSYQTVAGSGLGAATVSDDFIATSGTLSFAPGETSKTFTVSTIDDAVTELTEGFGVQIFNPSGDAVIGQGGVAQGAIIDNEPPPPSCTFTAHSHEGNDEFSLYARVQRTGSCSTNVTLGYSVQYISGTGSYDVANEIIDFGPVFTPSQQSKYLRISPYYGTVQAGYPLRLKVIWTIVDGSGSIVPSESYVTFYNSNCYC